MRKVSPLLFFVLFSSAVGAVDLPPAMSPAEPASVAPLPDPMLSATPADARSIELAAGPTPQFSVPDPILNMQDARDNGLKPIMGANIVTVVEKCKETELYTKLGASWVVSLAMAAGGFLLGRGYPSILAMIRRKRDAANPSNAHIGSADSDDKPLDGS